MKRCRTRHKHTGTLDKFNTHNLGVISLTLVPANEFRVEGVRVEWEKNMKKKEEEI